MLAGLVLASAVPVLAQTAAPAAPAAPPPPPTLAKIRDTGVIGVAYREASIPFSYLDQNKRPVGYAMDLCMRVVESLRRDLKMPSLRVELLSVTPATRIGAIKEGKADLECGSTTNNAARRKDVAFTVTHYYAGAKLLTRADSGITRLSDLRGKVIVSTRGTTPLAALRAAEEKGIIGGARILEGKDHDESFAMLERGEAQAFAMDDILLYSLRATAKDPKAWAVVGEFITVEPLAIMLRKDDPEFKKYVDTVLSRAMIDGEVRALYNKWFLSAIPPKGVNLGIPLSPLMRDQLSFPTDKVGDQLGG
jgi:glutamate/aspartate transport system substrate-binding protein